jgi:uncharacterized protein (TIGR02246 family)
MTAATFARLERAWNTADGAAFGAEFTTDADFVDVRGVHHRGRAAIASGHQAILDSIYRGSTVRYTVEETRQLLPTCSIALVGAVLDVPAGPLAGRRRARLTAVVVERDGVAAIAAFHNTLVEAAR